MKDFFILILVLCLHKILKIKNIINLAKINYNESFNEHMAFVGYDPL